MKTLIILGNGVTIDLMKSQTFTNIDAVNLFNLGAEVKVPIHGEIGFLSNKYCKNLWALGARPGMKPEEANSIIENIITCGNVVSTDVSRGFASRPDNLYLLAYYELTSYLRALFVEYNCRFDESKLKEIEKWGWIKQIKKYYDDPSCDKISIISFNYDVFLERILMKIGIEFDCPPFINNGNKLSIIKPHGSIAFKRIKGTATTTIVKENFENLDISDIEVDYKITHNDAYVPLIPPAGDSNRAQAKWVQGLQDECLAAAKGLTAPDLLIVGGLSYWNVDRLEVDKILVSLPNSISCKMVNPSLPETLDMVVSALFDNYTLFPSIDAMPV